MAWGPQLSEAENREADRLPPRPHRCPGRLATPLGSAVHGEVPFSWLLPLAGLGVPGPSRGPGPEAAAPPWASPSSSPEAPSLTLASLTPPSCSCSALVCSFLLLSLSLQATWEPGSCVGQGRWGRPSGSKDLSFQGIYSAFLKSTPTCPPLSSGAF